MYSKVMFRIRRENAGLPAIPILVSVCWFYELKRRGPVETTGTEMRRTTGFRWSYGIVAYTKTSPMWVR